MTLTLNKSAEPIAIDIKSVRDDGFFVGYASVFSQRDLGGDVVMPGAFTKSLQRYPPNRVRMLWQHRQDEPIGFWTALTEDGRGLKAEGQIILDAPQGKAAHALLKSGAIDGMSIGYSVVRDELDKKSGSRLLHEVELREISIVTFPMCADATVSAVKQSQTDFQSLVAAINAGRDYFKD